MLSDITLDIDDVLAITEPITIVNHAGLLAFADEPTGPLALSRAGRHVTVRSARTVHLADAVAARRSGESMLITNLDTVDLRAIGPALDGERRIVGFHGGQCWVLAGPAAASPPAQWGSQRARPLPLPAFAG